MSILKKILLLIVTITLSSCHSANNNVKKIGIIVPIEHKAMNEIISGFTDTIRASYAKPLKFKIANAQGDINIERAIIQQMKDENYDVIAPIGTDASLMSAAAIHQQPIISIAASISESDRQLHKPCHIAVVHDEIAATQLLQFIHLVYPHIQKIALIHSASDKVFPEVQAAITAGKQYGLEIKPLLVPTLNEIYSTANNLAPDTQAILVLKDSLIVSGISTLALRAQQLHIPLITSDQGSVQDGAAFALGVHEKDIGVEAGKLAAAILSGKSACELPIVEMKKLTVFVNQSSLTKEQQSMSAITNAANTLHYQIENMNNAKSAS